MSANFFSGYLREAPNRFRRGREVITFEPGSCRALVESPEGARVLEGMGAVNLRLMLEDACLEGPPGLPDGGGPPPRRRPV